MARKDKKKVEEKVQQVEPCVIKFRTVRLETPVSIYQNINLRSSSEQSMDGNVAFKSNNVEEPKSKKKKRK